MKILIILLPVFLLFFLAALIYFGLPRLLPVSPKYSDYRTDFSEGLCTTVLDTCKHIGEGCGGGHGSCSSFPQSPLSGISTCDINMDFPSMQNYECSCLSSLGPLGKCGWSK